jgi:hypothetical protein
MRQHCLAVVFVLLALLSAAVLYLLASGRMQLASEWPGLLVGAVLLALMAVALRR